MFTSLNTGALGLSIPFDEAVELASAHHFDALDLPIEQLLPMRKQKSVQELKASLIQAGLRPGGWGLPVQFRRDEATYQHDLQLLPQYAALASGLGATRCFSWIMPCSDELDYAANMAFHVQRLRPVAQILADYGCRFGLEFVGPKTVRAGHRYPFISTIEGALELGERIGTNNTGLLLDSWHWYTSHSTIEDLNGLRNEQVVYVHVNDAPIGKEIDEQIDHQRLLPGASGIIDIAGFLQALKDMGYDGPVAAEPFNAEHAALPAQERVQVARDSLHTIWQIAGLA